MLIGFIIGLGFFYFLVLNLILISNRLSKSSSNGNGGVDSPVVAVQVPVLAF